MLKRKFTWDEAPVPTTVIPEAKSVICIQFSPQIFIFIERPYKIV